MGNTQKYSQINYSKIAQKVLNIFNNDIVVASDRTALMLYFLLYSIINALTVFGIPINRKFREINGGLKGGRATLHLNV